MAQSGFDFGANDHTSKGVYGRGWGGAGEGLILGLSTAVPPTHALGPEMCLCFFTGPPHQKNASALLFGFPITPKQSGTLKKTRNEGQKAHRPSQAPASATLMLRCTCACGAIKLLTRRLGCSGLLSRLWHKDNPKIWPKNPQTSLEAWIFWKGNKGVEKIQEPCPVLTAGFANRHPGRWSCLKRAL